MTDNKKIKAVTKELQALYPQTECGLSWQGDPYRLLVMAILSAQCTDVRVNTVAVTLFSRYPDIYAMANADLVDLQEEIRSVGLYRTKAKNLLLCCQRVCECYDGKVPSDMEQLLTLAGVGRKVANLLRGDIFSLGGIVADTHCIRIAGRLGFSDGKDALKTEKALEKLIPIDEQSEFCHRLVKFGRETCKAQSPHCSVCTLKDYCEYNDR